MAGLLTEPDGVAAKVIHAAGPSDEDLLLGSLTADPRVAQILTGLGLTADEVQRQIATEIAAIQSQRRAS